MVSPVAEVKAFFRAALLTPVERDHTEPDTAFQRRRIVAATTLVVGAVAL
ncbi:MAG: CPBP family intramembrane metalloprotease, partial [Actinobacteria bacterium]|nr:CPBP family intramembrane metalloprotease [Actinomycetota bacterium]